MRNSNARLPASDRRRVVITGLGPITASGIGVDAFWEGLKRGQSPIRRVDRFDAAAFRSQLAAQVDDFDPSDFFEAQAARRLDRFGQFTLAATILALKDADLDPASVEPSRGAVQMGSALGGIAQAEEQAGVFLAGGLKAVNPRLALSVFAGAASSQTAIHSGFTGPNSTNAMSCASGTIAIGDAWRWIRSGHADVVLAGAAEAPLSPLSFGAFALIRAMSTRNDDPAGACRPFDEGRDGFIMGEAACVLVLEEEEYARRRGARIYAELSGYGTSSDAHHMTAPRPDGSSAARAMREALETAELTPEDVDHVNAHASSTPLNDAAESRVIRQVLGSRADQVPVTGTKPYYGHALGASGAVEVAIVALGISRGWIPPTLNLVTPGEDCDLNYVTSGSDATGKVAAIRHALSNSFGFGGINACLALSRVEG
ncbi:MAG: beta-ketoacyl-[acyl-carrier-protein] synthase family protein [Longimicrobiales bacterium]|nr:beta-ketoacyl-[acyl-carrier-protein] synthase family protein [Longimicrobiales bacterium]